MIYCSIACKTDDLVGVKLQAIKVSRLKFRKLGHLFDDTKTFGKGTTGLKHFFFNSM